MATRRRRPRRPPRPTRRREPAAGGEGAWPVMLPRSAGTDLTGRRRTGETPRRHEYSPQHGPRQLAREGVLLARMEAADERGAVRHGGARAVTEAGQRAWQGQPGSAPRAEIGVPAYL